MMHPSEEALQSQCIWNSSQPQASKYGFSTQRGLWRIIAMDKVGE